MNFFSGNSQVLWYLFIYYFMYPTKSNLFRLKGIPFKRIVKVLVTMKNCKSFFKKLAHFANGKSANCFYAGSNDFNIPFQIRKKTPGLLYPRIQMGPTFYSLFNLTTIKWAYSCIAAVNYVILQIHSTYI